MTFSSWIVFYLGFNLIAGVAPAKAHPAQATAINPSVTDRSIAPNLVIPDQLTTPVHAAPVSQSSASIIKPNLQISPVFLASGGQSQEPDPIASGQPFHSTAPTHRSDLPEAAIAVRPSSVAPASLTAEIEANTEPNLQPQVEQISQAAPLPSADVTVSADQCLADCNPTARFDFDPPNIAIPPRSLPSFERPAIAENRVPVPSLPSSASGTLPPPPPSRIAEQRDPVQSPTSPRPTVAPGGTPTSVETADSRRPVTPPTLQFQGVYLYQGGEDSARARVTGVYPILPELQVGASLDLTTGEVFGDSGGSVGDSGDGLEINELYVTGYLPDYPNLRLVVGQMDLTSYFDRNSFAKDSATHFFNPVFATNPALSAAAIGSRQGALANWTIIDEVEVKAAVFSSDRSISDFEVNAFAGEVGARLGNFIIRGTYVTAEDAGANTSFEESFQIARSNGDFGPRDGDREDAYGINAEFFIPEINMGIFGRYGWYNNRDLDEGGTTYSFGVNFLDVIMDADRLGVAYGRALSNDDLRDGKNPDVFEAFYDFRLLPGLRLGFTFQGLDEFSETIGGVRVRTDFDLVPRRTQ
jgi:hypothetical protein